MYVCIFCCFPKKQVRFCCWFIFMSKNEVHLEVTSLRFLCTHTGITPTGLRLTGENWHQHDVEGGLVHSKLAIRRRGGPQRSGWGPPQCKGRRSSSQGWAALEVHLPLLPAPAQSNVALWSWRELCFSVRGRDPTPRSLLKRKGASAPARWLSWSEHRAIHRKVMAWSPVRAYT